MTESPLRLLYIEDHPVMIRGLRDIFRPNRDDIYVAVSAGSAREAAEKAGPDQFDLIVLDLYLGEADPMDNIALLRSRFPAKPIVIYTGSTGVNLMHQAFRLGVSAWIRKDTEIPEIKSTLRRVACHAVIYPQEMLRFQAMANNSSTQSLPKPFRPDASQRAILDLLCQGVTIREMAGEHLQLSISGIEKKLQLMREQANAKTNYELLTYYLIHCGPEH